MQAPPDACKALYDLHPQLRLAWRGKERTKDGELNAGSFALIQLYHTRDVGDLDDPQVTYRELWDTTTVMTGSGATQRVRVDRGPIFSRTGRPGFKDWDALTRIPVFVATLDNDYEYADGTKLKIEDVFSGKFILAVKYWVKPILRRMIEASEERTRAINHTVDDIVGDAADYLWHEASKTGQTTSVKAKEFQKADGDWRRIYERDTSLNRFSSLPKLPKGARL